MVDRARDNHDWLHLNLKRWHFPMEKDGQTKQTKLQCKPLTKIDKIRIKHPSGIFLVCNRFHFLATSNPTDSNIHVQQSKRRQKREKKQKTNVKIITVFSLKRKIIVFNYVDILELCWKCWSAWKKMGSDFRQTDLIWALFYVVMFFLLRSVKEHVIWI